MKHPYRKCGLALAALALALAGCAAKPLTADETAAAAASARPEDAAWLDQALDAFLNDGDSLPAVTGSGAAVSTRTFGRARSAFTAGAAACP